MLFYTATAPLLHQPFSPSMKVSHSASERMVELGNNYPSKGLSLARVFGITEENDAGSYPGFRSLACTSPIGE